MPATAAKVTADRFPAWAQNPVVLALPVTFSETYMRLDDQPAYPSVFFHRLPFTGRLESARFTLACCRVAVRHLLLRAWAVKQGRCRRMGATSSPVLSAVD